MSDSFSHPHCPYHCFLSIPPAHPVDGLIKMYHFGRVLKQVELRGAVYQVAEPDTDEADEHAPLVEPFKKFFCGFHQLMVK